MREHLPFKFAYRKQYQDDYFIKTGRILPSYTIVTIRTTELSQDLRGILTILFPKFNEGSYIDTTEWGTLDASGPRTLRQPFWLDDENETLVIGEEIKLVERYLTIALKQWERIKKSCEYGKNSDG